MWTFKAYLKKEILESVRQYKYIMLAAGIIIFALLDPIMLKMLPSLLKGQLPAGLSALFVVTQKSAVQSYIKELNQIGLLFVIFVFSGTLSEEISNQKLVFPFSKGARPESIVLAKVLHYIITVCILAFIGFSINYYYITILFYKDPIRFSGIFPSITLVCIYYVFNIALALMFSSFFKGGLISGIITLSVSFISATLAGVDSISKFIPYKLINSANMFTFKESSFTIVFTLVVSIIFIVVTMIRMNKVEVI